jgi:hypothetical protein
VLAVSFGNQAIQGYVNAGLPLALGLTGKYTMEGGEKAGETDIRFGDSSNDGRRYLDNRLDFGLQFGGRASTGA